MWENAWAAVRSRERRRGSRTVRSDDPPWVPLPLARQRQLLAPVRDSGRDLAAAVRDRAHVRGARDRVRPGRFLFQPVPYWNPLHWNPGYIFNAFSGSLPGGEYWPSIRNTLVYVAVALGLCFAIGYPVAYYIARHAKRTKTLLIVLLVIPFWISYLLRMLAWIGLLSPGGYVNRSSAT